VADVLVLYVSGEGQTRKIAERVAELLEQNFHRATIASLKTPPELEGFDAVVIGASIHVGQYPKYLREFIISRRNELERVPTAFFSVCLTAAGKDEKSRQTVAGYLRQLFEQTGWEPSVTASFAGALRYSKYSFLKRQLVKTIAKRDGRPTDTSHDYEYTDWEDVLGFTTSLSIYLEERLSPVA
jgi:menaquinone-dependent protoporphyrinogen oxidase